MGLSDETNNLQMQDAVFRKRLRQALGLESSQQDQEIDPQTYALILKKKRIASILKEQMRAAGMDELADMTRIRRE